MEMITTKVAQVSWGTAFAVNTCIFGLKLFTRYRYLGGLKSDDYLAIIAQVSLLTNLKSLALLTFMLVVLHCSCSEYLYNARQRLGITRTIMDLFSYGKSRETSKGKDHCIRKKISQNSYMDTKH